MQKTQNRKTVPGSVFFIPSTRRRTVPCPVCFLSPQQDGEPSPVLRPAHEYKHFCDDRADGFPGMRIFMDTEKCKQREIDAYNVEIELARKANRLDIVKRLEELKAREVGRFDEDANAD